MIYFGSKNLDSQKQELINLKKRISQNEKKLQLEKENLREKKIFAMINKYKTKK